MAVAELTFWVAGRPVSQGNLTRNAAGAIYEKTKGLDAWRRSVSILCRKAAVASGWQRQAGPLELQVQFELPRPRSVDRRWPTVLPDLDKLTRAVGDALTGVAFDDDAQLVSIVALKVYAVGSAEPGAMITVKEIQ